MVAYSSVQVWIGVASEDIKTKASVDCYGVDGALSLDIANNLVYYDAGKTRAIKTLDYANSDRIVVKVDRINHTIEWEFVYPIIQPIAKISIPVALRNKVLLPVIHLGGSGSDKAKFV